MYAFPNRALLCLERKNFECPWRATGRLAGPLLFALGLHGAGFATLAVTRGTCKEHGSLSRGLDCRPRGSWDWTERQEV